MNAENARPNSARTPTLAGGIADAIEDAIISGRLGPRQRLIELEIGAAHKVSRAPVREALQMLERDGLVARTTRGFEVAGVSAAEAADVFEILAHLEELTTRKAAPHVGKTGLRALRGVLTQMKAASRSDDVAAYYRLNIQFHQIIRDACPNRQLIKVLDSLGKKTLRLRRLAMTVVGRMPVSLAEHQQIVIVLESGDAVAAGRLARQSAEQAYAALARFLASTMLD